MGFLRCLAVMQAEARAAKGRMKRGTPTTMANAVEAAMDGAK